ncbi:TPA: hypothetical protein N0F65_001343, partial [Lagenidium giganteum]
RPQRGLSIIYRHNGKMTTPTNTPQQNDGNQPSQIRRRAWIAYNVVVFTTIVVSGAILFMVATGIIPFDSNDRKKQWLEVSAQTINGMFTWLTFTNHPFFACRLYHLLRLLNRTTSADKKEASAITLSKPFPLVFRPTPTYPGEATHTTRSREYDEADVQYLRNAFIILNFNCLFQYPMTIVMWSYAPPVRPQYVVPVCLPLAFSCGVIGQILLNKLNKRKQGVLDTEMATPTHQLQPPAAEKAHDEPSAVAKWAWIIYNVVMFTVIVVSGAILFMVIVGMIQLHDKDKKDDWIEVNSQILNGVFTWMAFTNHPFFAYRLYHILRLLNPASNPDEKEGSALTLSKLFPLVFPPAVSHQGKTTHKTQTRAYDEADVWYLRKTFIILNFNCIFQYPMAIVMWSFNAKTRPGYIIGIFLPLSFLCNAVGQVRLFKLTKRKKAALEAAALPSNRENEQSTPQVNYDAV